MNKLIIASIGVLQSIALALVPIAPASAATLERTLTVRSAEGIPLVDATVAVNSQSLRLTLKTNSAGQVKFNSSSEKVSLDVYFSSNSACFSANLNGFFADGVANYEYVAPKTTATYRFKIVDDAGFQYGQNSQVGRYGYQMFKPVSVSHGYIAVKDSIWTGSFTGCAPIWLDDSTMQVWSLGAMSISQTLRVNGGTETVRYPVPSGSGLQEFTLTIRPLARIESLVKENILYSNQAALVSVRRVGLPLDASSYMLGCEGSGSIRGTLKSSGVDTHSGLVTASGNFSGASYACSLGGAVGAYYRDQLRLKVLDSRPLMKAALKVYKSCKDLNAVFPGGIRRSMAVPVQTVSELKTAFYSASGYKANSKLDLAKTGVACSTKY